jgi:hypothetical protein
MADPKKTSPFVSMFIPGLVLGLVVGGFGAAILLPMVERWGLGGGGAPVASPGGSTAVTGPRDPVPRGPEQPSPDPATPVDPNKPVDAETEPKPVDPAPAPAPK